MCRWEGKGECDSRLWRHKQVSRGMGGSRSGSAFLRRWSRSCRGRSWRRWSNRTIRRGKTDGLRWDWGIMLRVYFLQQWFNLSDPGAEDALYESPVLRHFVGIDLGRAPVPDESTILQFRHLLEKHELGGAMLNAVNQYLESRGIRITTGTIVDATIIHAPSSTKNRRGERDPEMHQTRKGKQYYFGLKAHIGVDSKQGHVHSVCTSAASVADKHMLPDLLHGEERKVWGDGAYQGQGEAIRQAAPQAQDMTSRRTRYKNFVDEIQRAKNRVKARVRAKVEHPFRILKRIFASRR